ncbi:MAG: hypothetical protein HYT93_05245 [Parcubacteria group bacterium]|nr:hypothetical protein [Parcubacteria group bacterium]
MNRDVYIPQMKVTFLMHSLRTNVQASNSEVTWLIPSSLKNWDLPVDGLVVSHSDEQVKEGTAEIWVCLVASLVNHTKTGGASMEALLVHSAKLQTDLVKLHGYEYDREEDKGKGGTIMLFKKIPFEKLQDELGTILALIS